MNPWTTFDQPVWRHLVFALGHTLWQGPALMLGLTLALRLLPARRADWRYALALTSQFSLVVALFVTWSILDRTTAPPPNPARPDSSVPNHVPAVGTLVAIGHTTVVPPAPSTPTRPDWTALTAMAWLFGVLAMGSRVIGSALNGLRLVRNPRFTDEAVAMAVERVRRELGLRRLVRVVNCGENVGPAVLGIFWPTLLLPASAATGWPPEFLRAVLAHELAHIRRHDYAVNLVQMAVESLLFFNPAAWWLGRQARLEREACCDATAVRLTSRPLDYSRWLADRAEATSRLRLAMTWKGQDRRSTLLERIRRILRPSDRPGVLPLTVPALFVAALLGPLVFLGLRSGSSAAVALAAQILTPAERMQRLETLKTEYAAAAPGPADGKGKATFRGRVVTPDGRPLARPTHGSVSVQSVGNGYGGSAGPFTDIFNIEVPPGTTWLGIQPDDYAPAMLGPFQTRAGQVVDDLTFRLEPGFPAQFRIVDETGAPIPAVRLNGGLRIGGAGSSVASLANIGSPSDAEGRITLPHAAKGPYVFSAEVPGFQPLDPSHADVTPDAPTTLTLRHARPIRGLVVDEIGHPVAGATLHLLDEREFQNHHEHGTYGPLLATTDGEGRFVLDRIKDGLTIAVLIQSPDQARSVAQGLQPGQDNLRLVTGRPLGIRGVVKGDLANAVSAGSNRKVTILQNIPGTRGGESIGCRWDMDLSTEGRFAADGLLPGPARVEFAGRSVNVVVDRPETLVTLDPSEQASAASNRRVILQIPTPEGSSEPTGTIRVTLQEKNRVGSFAETFHPIVRGEVVLDAPLRSLLSYEPGTVLGLWFHGEFVEVQPGEGPWVVDVPTVAAGAIAGRAFEADGSPSAGNLSLGVRSVEPPPGVTRSTVSLNNVHPDAEGRFFLSPLPLGGRYVVSASRGHNVQAMPPLALDASHPTADVFLRMKPPASASGRVTNAQGQPMAQAPLTIALEHPTVGTSWSPPIATDAEGRFRVDDLNPEIQTYRVIADRISGYLPATADLRVGGPPIEVVLEAGLVFEGRILDDASGRPIPGVEVYAHQQVFVPKLRFGYEAEGKTDDAGRFRFSNLPPGEWALGLRNANQSKEPTFSTPTPPGPFDVRVTLPPKSELKPVGSSP